MTGREYAVSGNAEHRPSDYRFERQRADRMYVPLMKSPPPFIRWGGNVLGAGVLAAIMAAAFATPYIIAWAN